MMNPYAALVIGRELQDHRRRQAERARQLRSARLEKRAGRNRPAHPEEATDVSR